MKTTLGRMPEGTARFLSRLRPIEADLPPHKKLLDYVLLPRNHAAVFLLSDKHVLEVALAYIPTPSEYRPISQWFFMNIIRARFDALSTWQSIARRAMALVVADWDLLTPDDKEVFTISDDSFFLGVVKTDIQKGGSWLTERSNLLVFGKSDINRNYPSLSESFIFRARDKDIALRFFQAFQDSITKLR